MRLKLGILTISDSVTAGTTEDKGGPAIANVLVHEDWTIARTEIVPDEQATIQRVLREWSDDIQLDVIFTTGGTGLSQRDVTPEATANVVVRLVPGIAEVLRAEGLKQTQGSMLSRGIAGTRGSTLIVNLPGSPKGAQQGAEILRPLLEHAVTTIAGAKH